MSNIVLAIATLAFATLAPFALAAEGQGDNVAEQPTMAELKAKMDAISTEIAALAGTVGNLATATAGTSATSIASKVDALATTVTANHTTIVGKLAQQMAVVMTMPRGDGPAGAYYLAGSSSIAGFPSGTVAANGQFTDTTLPVGTYLFELQQPHSDNVICQRSVSVEWRSSHLASLRRNVVCPRMHLNTTGLRRSRFNDGFGIVSFATPASFGVYFKFPTGFTFAESNPVGSYTGAVRITKLK